MTRQGRIWIGCPTCGQRFPFDYSYPERARELRSDASGAGQGSMAGRSDSQLSDDDAFWATEASENDAEPGRPPWQTAADGELSAGASPQHLTGARDAARRSQRSEVPDLPPPDPEIAQHIAEIRDQANLRQGSMRAHPTARRDD